MGNNQSCKKKKKKKFTIVQISDKENKQVTLDDFQILRAIGKGSFGKNPTDITSLTNYQLYDIGLAVGKILDDDKKLKYLNETWKPPVSYSFPTRAEGKQNRKFRREWLEQYNWLAYSELSSGGFCKMCVLFAPTGAGIGNQVCIVQKKDTMKMYAMKYVNKSQCVEKDAFKNVLREIEVLTELEHPFLVNLWFTFQDEEDMFMVVDLLLGGDLRYHLQQSNSIFDEERITLYLCEIALALDYLRSKKILHRDIKPDNILIDDAGHAHITDFNIATFVRDGEVVTSVSGTKPYMAPEVVLCALDHTHGYSFNADWWSLGVTTYEMACNMRPYEIHSGTSMEDIHCMIENSCVRFPKCVNKGLANLIQQMLSVDPKQRISSIKQMKRHHYLKSMDFVAVYNRQVTPPFIPNKDQLNCDPTFELEEMIIESKPLHKKKKRLSKRNKAKTILANQINQDEEVMQMCLSTIQKEFIIYNRESELQQQAMEEKRKQWEEELAKFTS